MLGFKGITRENRSSRNENVKMDVWPHKKRQDTKWLCMKIYWYCTNLEGKSRKSDKVVWTHTKATRNIRVDYIIFSSMKKGERETKKNIEKVVKKNLVINNIIEVLVFSWNERHCVTHAIDIT